MLFKVRRFFTAALVVSLFIQIQISGHGHAAMGAKIAYACWRDDNLEICVMDGDGGNQVRLTEHPAYDTEPSWSPDGTWIAFSRDYHIHVMDADGGNLMQIAKNTRGWDPAWSPDGTKIAYTCYQALKRQVWVMAPDGGDQNLLTQWGENYDPAWSPDGDRIAFVSAKRHAGPEIYVMDSDGDNQVRITYDLAAKENPSWSPDGTSIAYEARRDRTYQIFVVKTDGSGQTRRLTRNRPHKSYPAWSPDGTKIAYVTWNALFATINLMTLDGEHLKLLSENDDDTDLDPDWYAPVGWSVSPAANFVTMWGEIKREPAGR